MNTTPTPDSWTLDELATLVELPRRTVRYYIQLGLVDRPDGETRAARYGQRHLDQLLLVRKWTAAGLSLERIGDLLAGADTPLPMPPRRPGSLTVQSHLLLAEGLELVIEPGAAGLTPDQLRAFARAVTDLYEQHRRGNAGAPTTEQGN